MISAVRASLCHRAPERIEGLPFRRAAVVLPLLNRSPSPTVLLTRRPAHLGAHGGQIALPGGKLESGETATEAALREASEEVGLEDLDVLGTLDDELVISRFVVTPVVVACTDPPAVFREQPGEVERAFEIPLEHLATPENSSRALWKLERARPEVQALLREFGEHFSDYDVRRQEFVMYTFRLEPYWPEPAWGMTARILRRFLDDCL